MDWENINYVSEVFIEPRVQEITVNGTSPPFILLLPDVELKIQQLSREAKDYAALS